MNRLLKISDTHYIVVDDSEIKEEDYKSYFFHPKEGIVFIDYIKGQSCLCNEKMIDFFKGSLQKITHSTHCLKCGSYDFNSIGDFNNTSYQCNDCDNKWKNIKPLSLSEVEEAIYGYSVEKMAKDLDKSKCRNFKREYTSKETYEGIEDGFILGFNTYKELVKDKFILTKEQLEDALFGVLNHKDSECCVTHTKDSIVRETIKQMLPKKEWEVAFDQNGKIILI